MAYDLKTMLKTRQIKVLSEKDSPSKPGIKVEVLPENKSKHLRIQPQTATVEDVKEETPPFTVVAIGASAGGLEAITLLLQNLVPNTGMAFIYVQHLSPDHKSILTSLLSRVTKMPVQEIDDMEKMMPDNVYVIPYNKEIEVMDGHIRLIPRPLNKSTNLSIDVLFSSLAETHKENVIGIVLSGSANDGTRGLKEIKLAGGITFAQDDSAKFTSMPQSAIAEGVVDFVLSPVEIAKELMWISKHPMLKRKVARTTPEDEIDNSDPDLKSILQLLYKSKNADFSHYKMNTIKRRMLRRMLIHKVKTIRQYAVILSQHPEEVDLLYQDLLINVTDFFRDTEAFEYLKTSVLPKLLNRKAPNEILRIWVAACATGEEVYSIAILLLETLGSKTGQPPFQIFASDLSAAAISKARMGEYSQQQLKNVSPERLQRFFIKLKDNYRISKYLRDICVFAEHNILNDPPFSRMDLISCRNFLIYLDTSAQKKAIATFHYALNEGGYLFLGKSETIGTSTAFFSILNKKYKIYTRKKNSGNFRIPNLTPRISIKSIPEKTGLANTNIRKLTAVTSENLANAFDAALLTHYTPASVIINYDLEILQFRGDTARYLQHAPGKASFNILKMEHIEITFELRNAIHHAIKSKQAVSKTGIEISRDIVNHTLLLVNLDVIPLEVAGEEPMLVIVFSGQPMPLMDFPDKSGKNISLAKDRRINKLEEELAAARADMGAITQDQEAVNQELQSANEEIISSNEELQSLNEELETSKEEIESTNEELTTTNQELYARMQQVEELYTYYESILANSHEPMLVLDKNIRIKSVNEAFCKTFKVTPTECHGVSLYKLGTNQWNIPKLRELLEDIIPGNNHFHDFEVEQVFPAIGTKTMLLNAHRISLESQQEDLIVLTISDITEVKRLAVELQLKETKILEVQLEVEKKSLRKIEESNKRYNLIFMNSPFAFSVLKGKDMVITLANDSIKKIWGKGNHIEGKPLLEVLPELKSGPVPSLLENVFTSGQSFDGYEFLVPIKREGKMEEVYFNFVYQPYLEADETISGVTIIAYEVTSHVILKNELIEAKSKAEIKTTIAEDAVKAKQQFLSNMSHEIRTPMNAIIGFTNVMLKTTLDESQKEYIQAIKESGDALIILINDILDLAKVDAGKMTFHKTPFNLLASISTMLHVFETKIREKNLIFIKEYDERIPEILVGDPMRLRQIILNLVSNAVKFTSIGTITMRVRLLEVVDNKVTIEFSLSDTGIGIPENRLEFIFNDFEQAFAETTSSYGGTGLGLAIVKKLVELQEGSIAVRSVLGKGSVFSFILSFDTLTPDSRPDNLPANELEYGKTMPGNQGQIRILVAEDIPLNQLLLKIIIADFGFEIEVAENGKIAVEKLQNNKFDIILMDLQMPVMNGFDATEYIRNTLKSDIPIIALTADVTTMDVSNCKTVGINDYISKPIDEKLLYVKMMEYLKK